MNSRTDQQLLGDYAASRSEPAFAELVRRHVDMVYSTALRLLRDTHLAEDVTQAAFVALAQNARQLADRTVLSSWLHLTARNLAVKTIRSDVRRRTREQKAAAMNELQTSSADDAWKHIAPHLDDALVELAEPDRDALTLRYFERKSAQEMAETIGISPEAAQKRVNRAVERLRELFAKQGVAVGAGGFITVVSTNAVQAAPAGLAASVTAAAATTIPASTVLTATKIIAMTTLQKTIIAAALVAAFAAAVYEAHRATDLQGQIDSMRQQQLPMAEQLEELKVERDSATNRIARISEELQRAKSNSAELLKLRSEAGRLRETAANASGGDPAILKLASKVALLKQKMEEMPNRKIGEIQFASEKDWADAAWKADLSSEGGVRDALSTLRGDAINKFLNELMKDAMKKYLAAHDNIVPSTLSELKSYFDLPVTDEMLSHYKLMQTGKVNRSDDLVTLTYHADDEYDSNHGMSINGAWGGGYNRVREAVNSAFSSFQADNPGQTPTDPSQLQTYLKQPIDASTVQTYINEIASHPLTPELATVSPILKAYQDANNGNSPKNAADVLPYITTPEQIAAIARLDPDVEALEPALKAYSAATSVRSW